MDRLPPKNAMLQLARLSVALQQPWLWCMGAATRRYDELSEPCNVDQCVSIANCWSAQPALRNAGRLVRIDPLLGTAEFISNSAILQAIRHQRRAYGSSRNWPRA